MASYDLKLHTPSTILVSGPSQCGKTSLIENLLTESGVFNRKFREIHWIYAPSAENKELIQRLTESVPVKFHSGQPEGDLANIFVKDRTEHKLLILDDILTEPSASHHAILDLFNITCHHQNITVILTVQNLYGSTPAQRSCLSTLLRSVSYLVLFACRRMTPVVRNIANSYFPGEQNRVLKPFNTLLGEEREHCYLVLDFVTNIEKIRIREGGLVPSDKCFIYNDEEN
jgi:hypothetical protein